MIFQYIIVEHPTKKDAEKGDLERVIVEVTTIAAKDEPHAKTLALLELGKDTDILYDPKRIEVLARPFK